jgi:hypothetical protein
MKDSIILLGKVKVHAELNFLLPEIVQPECNIDLSSGQLRPDDLLDTVLEKAQTFREFDADVTISVIHRARLHDHLP